MERYRAVSILRPPITSNSPKFEGRQPYLFVKDSLRHRTGLEGSCWSPSLAGESAMFDCPCE